MDPRSGGWLEGAGNLHTRARRPKVRNYEQVSKHFQEVGLGGFVHRKLTIQASRPCKKIRGWQVPK